MANAGLDPSDAIRLLRDAKGDGVLHGFRGKTKSEIAVPIGRRLKAALAEAPEHMAITLLVSSKGRPWTYDGLSTAFQRLKARLEKAGKIAPGLTMKGLRHPVATTLREAGLDDRTIADLLGQKTTSVEALDEANEKRTDVVKPFPKNVKPKEV